MTSANYLNCRTDKEKEILWCDYGNKETAGRVRRGMIFTPKRGSASKNTQKNLPRQVSRLHLCVFYNSRVPSAPVWGTVRVGALKILYSIDLSYIHIEFSFLSRTRLE